MLRIEASSAAVRLRFDLNMAGAGWTIGASHETGRLARMGERWLKRVTGLLLGGSHQGAAEGGDGAGRG